MRIESIFGNNFAFMPYVCCGDPNLEFTIKLIKTLVENGADAIELGIPFSDPIADGKTIQMASNRALKNGMTPKKALDVIRKIREDGITVPIIAMTYYNIVYANGIEKFVNKIKDAGADGLIVPDVPYEESEELYNACTKNGIDLVYLVTPNTVNERIRKIAEKTRGFLYAVSVLGTTGTREEVSKNALDLIKRVKNITKIPIVVGFGISKPEQAEAYANAGANGIIIGSKIVNIYSTLIDGDVFNEKKALELIREFAKTMKNF